MKRYVSRKSCVYEHWRPDTNKCFYVGKGKDRRAKSFSTCNSRYDRIVAKLERNGLKPIVKIVADKLTDPEAIALEIKRIAYWRAKKVAIANYTNGGDGTVGYVHSKKTKRILSIKATGRVASEKTKRKIGASHLGQKRTLETRRKQSESAKVAQKKRFEELMKTKAGRIEVQRRMLQIARKAAADPKVRSKRSENAKILWADPEYRAKQDKHIQARGPRCRCTSRPVIAGLS